jgi:hypothetical protein
MQFVIVLSQRFKAFGLKRLSHAFTKGRANQAAWNNGKRVQLGE